MVLSIDTCFSARLSPSLNFASFCNVLATIIAQARECNGIGPQTHLSDYTLLGHDFWFVCHSASFWSHCWIKKSVDSHGIPKFWKGRICSLDLRLLLFYVPQVRVFSQGTQVYMFSTIALEGILCILNFKDHLFCLRNRAHVEKGIQQQNI